MAKIKMRKSELCWTHYEVEWDEETYNEWKNWNLNLDVNSIGTDSRKVQIEAIQKLIKNVSWEEALEDFNKYVNATEDPTNLLHIETDENPYTGRKGVIYLYEILEEAISEDCWNSTPETDSALDIDAEISIEEED